MYISCTSIFSIRVCCSSDVISLIRTNKSSVICGSAYTKLESWCRVLRRVYVLGEGGEGGGVESEGASAGGGEEGGEETRGLVADADEEREVARGLSGVSGQGRGEEG